MNIAEANATARLLRSLWPVQVTSPDAEFLAGRAARALGVSASGLMKAGAEGWPETAATVLRLGEYEVRATRFDPAPCDPDAKAHSWYCLAEGCEPVDGEEWYATPTEALNAAMLHLLEHGQ
ncbi:hypothetical protein PZ938_07610 [Luteipulveratus sp. YIM 133132]|uniref:hypothetical protein n=1 Tax=Luteipulveratus flavus TaxID=3031728 RepID=UPI0023B0B37A|nr:hypothetical protein [Luteipulveratus sp. YIM 133132]MDE9365468.1 hypothetical protein [Luteipulveratus sp. YIM 133132]